MADGPEIRITGLPAFSSRLKELSADMQRKVVRAGATAAGTVFRKAASANAPTLKKPDTRKKNPRIPGALKRAVYATRSRKLSKAGTEVIVVGVRSGGKESKSAKTAFYWRFVEDGHLVRGRGQKIKGGTKRAGLERKRLKAAGARFIPGRKFLARAFKSEQQASVKAFNLRIEARLKKAQRDLNVR